MLYTDKDEPILTIKEQNEIITWVRCNYSKFKCSRPNCYMSQLDLLHNIPKCINIIKKRIMDKEQLYGYKQEPIFRDSIGYMIENGYLQPHTDPNEGNLIHTRFNVYVQIPEQGGLPVYGGIKCSLKERTYICCRSGLDLHFCEPVKGERERIVLSFGFLVPLERVANIVYDYK